jgi:hypothetical protein
MGGGGYQPSKPQPSVFVRNPTTQQNSAMNQINKYSICYQVITISNTVTKLHTFRGKIISIKKTIPKIPPPRTILCDLFLQSHHTLTYFAITKFHIVHQYCSNPSRYQYLHISPHKPFLPTSIFNFKPCQATSKCYSRLTIIFSWTFRPWFDVRKELTHPFRSVTSFPPFTRFRPRGCKYVLLGGVYPCVRARSRCMRLPPSTLPGITRGPTRSGARQVSSSDSAPAQVTSPVLLIDYFLYKNCL